MEEVIVALKNSFSPESTQLHLFEPSKYNALEKIIKFP
jgi:hypothetical protein